MPSFAFSQGYDAWCCGKSPNHNPYPDGTKHAADWLAGLQAACHAGE